ncbi:hypothetical protein ACFPA8_07875 [Streptomyces ovatisporus]|uniref:DUF7455 domain-containing protein n=1 Tax=Streptomyces ovatisporus TaxID=1128682 RepID=A0ABV9A4Z2_9ACTN
MNLTSRCDAAASGSEAGTRKWTLPGKGQLVLCGHHSTKHADKLSAAGWLLTEVGER